MPLYPQLLILRQTIPYAEIQGYSLLFLEHSGVNIMSFMIHLVFDFFVAMGMVLGGSLLGGIAALLTHVRPAGAMLQLASQLKIWALVSTLGGTMDTLRAIETSVLGMNLTPIARQFMYLIAAFIGCQFGYIILRWLIGSEPI